MGTNTNKQLNRYRTSLMNHIIFEKHTVKSLRTCFNLTQNPRHQNFITPLA